MKGNRRLAIVEVLFGRHSRIRHSMGFAVIDKHYDSNYTDINQGAIDQIVKYMGFTGLHDYSNAFSIKSPENSVMNSFYNIYKNRCKDVESLVSGYQIGVYMYSPRQDGHTAESVLFTAKIRAKQLNNDSYMFPILMADVKKVAGCKRIPKKDLWFCTDWKE